MKNKQKIHQEQTKFIEEQKLKIKEEIGEHKLKWKENFESKKQEFANFKKTYSDEIEKIDQYIKKIPELENEKAESQALIDRYSGDVKILEQKFDEYQDMINRSMKELENPFKKLEKVALIDKKEHKTK